MTDIEEESIEREERQRMREEEVEDDVSEDEEEEEDEETAGEEESTRESTAPSLSSLLSSPSIKGKDESVRRRRNRPMRSHALVELTSLDELSLPTNSARSIKYTCIAASRRLLVLGTSTGSVYVFARFSSRHRVSGGGGRLNAIPLHVYPTKDGPLHAVRISPNEQSIAVGGESGRVSVLSLAAAGGAALAAGSAAGAATAAPSSPASALVHTVPGDARSPDRVNCLCWSSDSSLVYAAHASGLVAQHKIGTRRSVFRSSVDKLLELKGSAVQMDYAAATTDSPTARLLISTPEATFIHDLQAGKAYQVGNKPRNAPVGACWMKVGNDAATDDFVLAARPNGRIWEASTKGNVYKTHQLRKSSLMPTLDPLSFRDTPSHSSFLQQTAIDTETARTTVHLGNLAPITVDSAPSPSAPSSDALSLPSTSSAATFYSSTVSSSVTSSTATVSSEAATRFVCSAVRSTLFVADIDRSQLVVVSDLGYVIRDWVVCGSDVFVLFSGSGSSSGSGGAGLRKYTLFPLERAADRLLARKGILQAARLVLSVRPSESTVADVSPRDTVAAGWPMPLIEKIQSALAAIKKKESESLRRQLNDLVCGGDRKPSIGEEEIEVVSGSISSLAVARTRQVSTSDRYLDRRRPEREEGEEGAESEYEDGDGGVIRRERGRRRKEEDERSRSSPDSLRPLTRPTAASAAKNRAVSPRSEDRRVRREELKRAKRLLESDTSHLQTEHRDSLRTLLELGSPPPMQFKHSVTVASVARNLAELARVAPPTITELLVERRTTAKPSSSSKRGGARVVKAIRPQRPTSGGTGGGTRKSAVRVAMDEEERNSNVLLLQGTKKSHRSAIEEGEDSENNVDWRREKRMGGVFLREEGGVLTRATVAAAPQGAESAADAATAAAAELHAQRCDRCGLHKSWLAVFLFGAAVHRVNVIVREGAYGRGGVPSTTEEWCDAMEEVMGRKEERKMACDKCEKVMMKAMESVPISGRFCDGLRPTATRVNAEAMREKVLSLPEEVLRAAVFGVRTERRKRRNGEMREEKDEKQNGIHRLSTATVVPIVSGEEAEKENGNGEEKEERDEEGESEGRKWMEIVDVRQILTAALFALGREGLREMITQRINRCTLSCLADGDWASLARLLAPRENTGTTIPIQVGTNVVMRHQDHKIRRVAFIIHMARTMLKEYGMHKFISIEGPSPQSTTVTTPTPSIRGGGYGRRVASIESSQSVKEPATVSWPMDTTGVCPMCSLPLTAVVSGSRKSSGDKGGGGGGDIATTAGNQLVCYPCGHTYHEICIGEATRRRQIAALQGISPVCIVCRVRARRSKAAAVSTK